MKFIAKYPDMLPMDDECNNIMRSYEFKPCAICGTPTEYIEINYEAHLCSDECVHAMDMMCNATVPIPTDDGRMCCDACGYQIKEGQTTCAHCNRIIDWDK